MKISVLHLVCAVVLALCSCDALCAQGARPATEKAPAPERSARGGVFTLYGFDPLTRALCFRDNKEGFAFLKNRWENRCSDLSFTFAGGGSLVSGIEANRIASIIDLGTAEELRDRYGYDDSDAGGEGFASLQLQGDGFKLMILKDNEPETLQPLKEATHLFTNVGPSANVPVKLGHIYIVRLTDPKDRSFQLLVKLVVIAYTPNELVTIRWVPL